MVLGELVPRWSKCQEKLFKAVHVSGEVVQGGPSAFGLSVYLSEYLSVPGATETCELYNAGLCVVNLNTYVGCAHVSQLVGLGLHRFRV